MVNAALVGLLAASSLLVGAGVAFVWTVSDRVVGLIMAFGAGVLMSAVAYELVAEALRDQPSALWFTLAFALGAVAFYSGTVVLERRTRRNVSTDGGVGTGPVGAEAQGEALVLGAVLDGIPESVVLGVSLIGGGVVSLPMLLAVFISNVPEALAASSDLARGGVARSRITAMWSTVVVASAIAAAVGYSLLSQADPRWVAAVELFSGGAIIAMLAESMIPEAYEKGGKPVSLATALGFALGTALSATT